MPLFTYRCVECDETTEKLVLGIKDADPVEQTPLACGHCGMQGALRHTLQPAELKFKGIRGRSGFHSVDYPSRTTLGTKTKVAVPDMSNTKGGSS